MPSALHQSLLELLKLNPRLVFELAHHFDAHFGVLSNEYEAASNEFPDPASPTTILHADWAIAEIAAQGSKRVPTNGVAVEIETTFDPLKKYSWLSYAAGIRRLFLCRGWTLVFAPDDDVRRKAQNMFEMEPRASPWFVVPDMLPPIIDVHQSAKDIDRSVLTTVFQARSRVGVACARATLEALKGVAHPYRMMYRGLVQAALKPEQVDRLPRELIDWDDDAELGPMELTGAYYVRGHNEGLTQGRVQGFTQAIEATCELLGIPFGPSERAHVQTLDADRLAAVHAHLLKTRRWPG